jgi:hypothetical protein
LLGCVASVYQGALLENALMTGMLGFFLWYIILDVIYRVFFRNRKKSNNL